MKHSYFCFACCLLATAAFQPVQAADGNSWDVSGDLRAMYSSSWRDTRAGTETDGDTFGSRLRIRLRNDLNQNWRIQGRFASTFEDKGNDAEFYIRPERESAGAVEPGTSTLDELFLQYRSDDRKTEFRLGRMQSTFTLPLITSKSLDRNQASNINIGWTDGIYLGRQITDHWKATLMGQFNSHEGNGTLTRGPLDFTDSGSRLSAFATLESDAEIGPIFLRALTLTWYPDALAFEGLQSDRREDYTAATFKMAAGWDIGSAMGQTGTRLVVAGSIGQSFNQPENAVLGLPGDGDTDGFAWHLGADIVDLWPAHTLGVIFGEADAGWLISNDYRQNDSLAEFRWSWQVTEPLRLQFRARWRREAKLRDGAAIAQRDRDMRLRATWKF